MKATLFLLGILALSACTNVEMNPYADVKGPTPAPVYGSAGVQPNFGTIDARIQSGNMPYIPAGGTTYVETVNVQ